MKDIVIAQKGSYKVELKEGQTYLFCTCGRSQKQPFCDLSSHKETGHKPLSFKAEKDGLHYLCGCKHTGNKPYCDGTHKKI